VLENGASGGLKIASFAPGGRWAKEDGWVSHCYGERERAPVCVFSAPAEGAFEIITFLLPDAAQRRVEEIEVSGGRGFEIRSAHSRDVVIVKDTGNVGEARTPTLISDFEYTWLRTEAREEAVLLGGRRLTFEGRKLVESAEYVETICR
jgi:hypothetical protein